MLINPQGRVSFVNDAAREILSLPDLAGTPRAEWWDLFPAEMGDVLRLALERVLEGEAVQFPAVLRLQGAEDDDRWQIMSSPVMNSDGQVESVFSIIVADDT